MQCSTARPSAARRCGHSWCWTATPPTPAVLDGNFDEDWGDCLYLQPILHHGEQKNHTVEITILPTEDETPTEFYLMALITA